MSLVGAGGTGKTRFVQHYAWRHLGDYAGGIWFCDLAAARSADGVFFATAQGLGLPLGREEPVDQIGNAIAGRGECLVVLDNVEQVAPHVRQALGRWLDRAHAAHFVVTSREILGLDGEEVMTLPPLARHEAIALFVQRAATVQGAPRFAAEDERSLATLVDLLDGLPLAIELAAARMRLFTLPALLGRMRDRFKLLTSGDGRPSRQATLLATLDWSWDLLTPPERAALAQLSVFEGSFDLAAVEAVVALEDGAMDVVDVLQSLLEKSLVQRAATGRFSLLKSVQDYATLRLDAPAGGTARGATEARHWLHYGALDDQVAAASHGADIENLATATRRAVAHGSGAASVRALERLWSMLRLCGPYGPAVDLARLVLASPDLAGADRGVAAWVAGNALQHGGFGAEAAAHYADGLAAARAVGAMDLEGRLLCSSGAQLASAGRHGEARPLLEASLRLARSWSDARQECASLNALAGLHQQQGDLRSGQAFCEEALAVARLIGDRRWEGGLTGNIASIHHALGRLPEAQMHYEQAIRLAQEIGDKRWESNARSNLGMLLGERGALEPARVELTAALAAARELGHRRLESIVACNLGLVCDQTGDRDAARQFLERALTLAEALGDRRIEGQARGCLGLHSARRGAHADARRHLERGEALLDEAEDDFSLAQLLCQRAESLQMAGDATAAHAFLQRAARLVDRLDVRPESPLRTTLDRLNEALEAQPIAA